jgi:peptide chain release factor 3
MVPDAANGVEEQTRTLRGLPTADIPIITFVNKLDREGRDPLNLMLVILKLSYSHTT